MPSNPARREVALMPVGRRFKAGEHNFSAVLTPELVRRLRQLRAEGWTYTQLSDEFGIDRKHAWRICHGLVWSWLND
jgi:hypothetical protein